MGVVGLKRASNPTFSTLSKSPLGHVINESGGLIAKVYPADPSLEAEMQANLDRIIECVNACREIPCPQGLDQLVVAAKRVLNNRIRCRVLGVAQQIKPNDLDALLKALMRLGI